MDIGANIKLFRGDGDPERRFASFDYCFNHFQSFRKDGKVADIAAAENMLQSCLHLGFYLARWGMFRGSSGLRSRSLKQFEPVVELIARTPEDVWTADAHCYSDSVCRSLVGSARNIQQELHYPDGAWPTKTLATKIMLGVFGNVPAFDSRVVAGLHKTRLTGRFGLRALRDIGLFYDEHHELIDRYQDCTLDFATGQPTQHRNTRAKVIDEIFYIEGRAASAHSDRMRAQPDQPNNPAAAVTSASRQCARPVFADRPDTPRGHNSRARIPTGCGCTA